MVMNRTLSTNVLAAATVVAATETVVAQLNGVATSAADTVIDLDGWLAFTTGTLVTAIRLRIRRDSLTGTVVADSGAITAGVAASAPHNLSIDGRDSIPASGQRSYVLTVETTGAGTNGTPTACDLAANYTP